MFATLFAMFQAPLIGTLFKCLSKCVSDSKHVAFLKMNVFEIYQPFLTTLLSNDGERRVGSKVCRLDPSMCSYQYILDIIPKHLEKKNALTLTPTDKFYGIFSPRDYNLLETR